MSQRFRSYEDVIDAAKESREERVKIARTGSRAVVRLDDPSSRNAFSAAQVVQLRDAIQQLVVDRSIRTVILTGEGAAFSTGGHLGLMRETIEPLLDGPEGAASLWRWISREYGSIARAMVQSDTIFIAAVNGVAAGVAFALIFNCDLVLAAESAVLVSGFAQLGLIPEAGGAWQLTRKLGYQGAFDLLTSGRHLSAQRGLELGLINQITPDSGLLDLAHVRAAELEKLASHVAPLTKAVLRQAADLTWNQALALEECAQPLCFSSQHHRDAVKQLLELSARRRASHPEGATRDTHA